jgi:Uma2 family endonuclease
MPTLTGRMTAADFLALPEDPNRVRYELVHGEVVVSPSPNRSHSFVSLKLSSKLLGHVEERDLGMVLCDIDTCFGPDEVRRPDIVFFTRERMHLIGEDHMEGPPDLCVEILSPSNKHIDRGDKFELYRDSGVPYYWLFDPMLKTVEGYQLGGTEYVPTISAKDNDVVRLPPFEDLEIRLGDIWWPDHLC